MQISKILPVVVLNALIGGTLCTPVASADEISSKLLQLEQAVKNQPTNPPKFRNIQIAVPAAQTDMGSASSVQTHTEMSALPVETLQPIAKHCSSLPLDSKSTAVDFTIQFKNGSAELTKPAEIILQKIASALKFSDKCVLVEGHTNSIGNANYNITLSGQRADSVIKFISENSQIPQSRFIGIGKGFSEPLKQLDPRNPKNRRVVFKIIGA